MQARRTWVAGGRVRHVTHPRDPAQGPHRARSLPGEAGGRKLRGRDVAERVGPRERLALPAQEEEAAVLATAQQRRCLGDQAGPCFRCLRPRLREGKFGGIYLCLFFLNVYIIHLGKNGTRENYAQEIWGLGLNPGFTGARLDGPLPGACAVLRLVVLQPDRDAAILLLQHEAAAAAASEARALRA